MSSHDPARGASEQAHAAGSLAPVAGRRSLILAAAMMATFMAAVESTIVATAMPTIVADLGDFQLFSWVFAVYLLTQGVSVPIYGRLADLYGRKRIFFAGAALFLVGSTLCGFARGMLPLIAFRALQGVGAGAVQPVAYTIVGDIYTPAERARIQGLLSGVFGVAAVVGPTLGAFLVEHADWPIVFWINLPIGAAAIAMLAIFYHEKAERSGHQVDYLGSLLLMLGGGALMLALIQGGNLARGTLVLCVSGGVAALAVLAWYERRIAEPILPLRLWRNRVIALGGLGSFSIGAIVMSISAFLPTYVQGAMGRSATSAGIALGGMSVSWAVAAVIGGRFMIRTSYRASALFGGAMLVLGNAVLVAMTPASGLAWAGMGALLVGFGLGFCNTTYLVSVQAAVSWHERGAATASNMFMRITGQSIGAAFFGALVNAGILHYAPQAAGMVERLMDPVQRQGLGAAANTQLTGALAAALQNVYITGAALSVIVLVLGARLPPALSPTRAPGHD
jgi:EmrB/QacA subfamily drug resistance transporter